MKPLELYLRTPESISKDLSILRSYTYNHVTEIKEYFNNISALEDKNTKIQIKIYKHFDYDYRRFWRLASVWFEEKPVMIIQNAGREGDDSSTRFITDETLYVEMVQYIKSLIPAEFETQIKDLVDPEIDIENLTNFYDGELDGYFTRYKI